VGKVSDKYVAGFLDSDGSIQIVRASNGRDYLRVTFTQKESNSGVIDLIEQWLPKGCRFVNAQTQKNSGLANILASYVFNGQKAVDILCRLKPYLVTKRAQANDVFLKLGFKERVGTYSMPNYPSAKWLAGYFDGDGSLNATLTGVDGRCSANVSATIATRDTEQDGILLIQKAFGGSIYKDTAHGVVLQLQTMDAAKVIAFVGYFAKYSLIKREQAYFLLSLAKRHGHFRDARSIVETLQELKAHPHRLSDLGVEVDVSKEVAKVQDLSRTEARVSGRFAYKPALSEDDRNLAFVQLPHDYTSI
jgi:hypothetical protein